MGDTYCFESSDISGRSWLTSGSHCESASVHKMAAGATISERLKRAAAVNEFRDASITVIVGFI